MALGTLSGTASKIFVFLDADPQAHVLAPFQIKWWAYACTSGGVLITDTAGGVVYRDAQGFVTFNPTTATAASVRTQIQSAVQAYYNNGLATVVALMDTSGLLGL